MLRAALAGVATVAALGGPGAEARTLRPVGSELRVVALPVAQPGERVPTRRQLDRSMRRTRTWLTPASYARLRLAYVIAPPVRRPREHAGSHATRCGGRRAAARGVDVAGAIPVLIEATRRPSHSYGNPGLVQIRGDSWCDAGGTGARDYFVDTRRRTRTRDSRLVRAPRGAAISRAPAVYSPDRDIFPVRIPATGPERACRATRECLARQIFRPGRSFTVPGAFRLRVLRGGGPVPLHPARAGPSRARGERDRLRDADVRGPSARLTATGPDPGPVVHSVS